MPESGGAQRDGEVEVGYFLKGNVLVEDEMGVEIDEKSGALGDLNRVATWNEKAVTWGGKRLTEIYGLLFLGSIGVVAASNESEMAWFVSCFGVATLTQWIATLKREVTLDRRRASRDKVE